MKTYVVDDPVSGRAVHRDRRRWLWVAGFFYPMLALTGIGLYEWSGSEWAFVVPLVATYGGVPLLDRLFGKDSSNPPEAVMPLLDADRFYRLLPMATVPVSFVVLTLMVAFVAHTPLSWPGTVALALAAGLYSGLGINTAHELGHKNTGLEQILARIVLAVPGYGHFCVCHNQAHHSLVATPEDPASSRLGENIYQFALREIPGGFRDGWRAERDRLHRRGKPVWHPENRILQSYALTVVFQGTLIGVFGVGIIPFLLIHNVYAWWQLTSANYVEHYGLLRARTGSGRYERCRPWHSWNADFIASNLLLFHLERHSDHHAHPSRRYQCLRSYPDLPTLPAGYFAMFLLALIPWAWYRVMDRRVLALPHVNGDLSRLNVQPGRRSRDETKQRATADIFRAGFYGLLGLWKKKSV